MKSIFVTSKVIFIVSNPAIDIAVFEKQKKAFVIFIWFGWDDIGSCELL